MIAHNKPTINAKEVSAVSGVLNSGMIKEGKKVEEFERALSKYLGQKGQAAAFSSGTAALYIALLALGIRENDEIIIPTYLCSSVLNAIFLLKAKPVLVDINYDDLNISFEETKKKITKKTKAIIVTHTFGVPVKIYKFLKLNIPVIEDCAQSVGAEIKGRKAGNFGAASIFSFYASKIITTGYGGAVFSGNRNFMKKIIDYREFDCRKDYKPRFNFQMTDFQAAMGAVQLKKLPDFLKKRRAIAGKYYKVLPQKNVWPPNNFEGRKPNFYRFLIKTSQPVKLKKFLEARKIKTIVPIEKYELLHRYLGQDPRNFPVSEETAKTTLSLPIYPSLSRFEIGKIKNALREFSQKYKL